MYHPINVDILVNGQPIRKYPHDSRTFIESRHGVQYSIRVKNNTADRVLAVVSVDGINVINGQPAGNNNTGYLVNGFGSVEIKGFRVSDDEVHPFVFSSKKKSYAAKSDATNGDTTNCGVIGVRIFSEKQVLTRLTQSYGASIRARPLSGLTYGIDNLSLYKGENPINSAIDVLERCASKSSAGGVSCSVADFDMGTKFGEQPISDSVRNVEFKIGSELACHTIYYASFKSLQSMGVPVQNVKMINAMPEAFPNQFCTPPRR